MQNADVIAIAMSMCLGASAGLFPESCAKKVKNGILIPEWDSTPAEAKTNANQIIVRCSTATELSVKDLVTKPDNNGKADIEAAAIRLNISFNGIVLYKPNN